jgi:hypothetical protein
MTHNLQVIAVVSLMFALGFMLQLSLARSAVDAQTIEYVVKQNMKLTRDLSISDRLNDILTGRLYEMTKFVTGEVDEGLDAYKRLLNKIESNLAMENELREAKQ